MDNETYSENHSTVRIVAKLKFCRALRKQGHVGSMAPVEWNQTNTRLEYQN